MKPEIQLSIVVVNYNVRDYLAACLDSVRRSLADVSYEIIVVDNASTDGSLDELQRRSDAVVLIRNESNAGFAKANNQAFAMARGRFILMLNPDTEIIDRTVQECLRYGEEYPKSIIGSRLLNTDRTFQCCGLRFPAPLRTAREQLLGIRTGFKASERFQTTDWVLGAFMMFPRTLLEEVGGLDGEYFLYGEEKDLCFRARTRDFRVVCYAEGGIVHHGNKSAEKETSAAYLAFHQSQIRFVEKHYSRINKTLIAGVLILATLRGLVFWNTVGRLRCPHVARERSEQYLQVLKWYLRK